MADDMGQRLSFSSFQNINSSRHGSPMNQSFTAKGQTSIKLLKNTQNTQAAALGSLDPGVSRSQVPNEALGCLDSTGTALGNNVVGSAFKSSVVSDAHLDKRQRVHQRLVCENSLDNNYQGGLQVIDAQHLKTSTVPNAPGKHANNTSSELMDIHVHSTESLQVTNRDCQQGGHKDCSMDAMEAWLYAHPEFAHAYFTKKATRSMVDTWLSAHVYMCPSTESLRADNVSVCSTMTSHSGSSGTASTTSGSECNTPVRKISAQEFERDGQILKSMVNTVDGQVTFLSCNTPSTSETPQKILRQVRHRKSHSVGHPPNNLETCPSREDLEQNEKWCEDERELMYSLVMDICHDLDVTSLCHKILQNVSVLLNADRCSLFLVQGEGENRALVSKLFDVSRCSTIAECTQRHREVRVQWGRGIAGTVAATGRSLNISDAYQDDRFNRTVDEATGYKTRSVLCMPIMDSRGEVIGVAEAINKHSISQEPFSERDEKVFSSYLAFCGIGLRNAQLYERSQLENRRNQLMLDLARLIFEEQKDVASLIHKIMMHTQSLLQCARCQVLLVDELHKGLFSQVFDLQASDFDNNDVCHRVSTSEPRFPINIGITGYVASTGQTLNIPDAYADERFDQSVDTGDFRTESILCMPIKNASGRVVGVAQFLNKLDHTPFNKTDEHLFEAFAIFCGMGIHNTTMYEKACKARARQQVALEILSYHSRAPECEVAKLQSSSMQVDMPLYDFSLDYTSLDDDGTLRACVRMFNDLHLTRRFRISHEVLCRWLLSVKKNYRDVTYHNWGHAFNVAHTMFCMITLGGMRGVLCDKEVLALLVACLSHDLDHRGTNNQFQIKSSSPLAKLYSTSTMEHHHFDQCIMILNTKGSDLLCHLSEEEYESVIKILENAILATDLALYFRYRGEFFRLVDTGSCDWNMADHKELLRAMMMTACDVSAISKPWKTQKKVAELIYNEFFEQGDLEKEQFHIKPIDIMNRDKRHELPKMQVDFIDGICLPVYQHLSQINSKLTQLEKGCLANRDRWRNLATESEDSETAEQT